MITKTTLAENAKGYIECPNGCGEKDLVFESATGRVSHKCPKCGKYAIFDYDKLEAFPSTPVRGAIHNLKLHH